MSEWTALILFFVGLYGLIVKKNIVKTLICLSIMSSSIILFFISPQSFTGNQPPIGKLPYGSTSDPTPQALMITAIVIGVSVTAVSLAMFIRMYHRYGTINWLRAATKRKEADR